MQDWLIKQFEEIAAAAREAGCTVEIDHGLPWVAVSDGVGGEWFFQEHEAEELLATVPEELHAEDYILAVSQGW